MNEESDDKLSRTEKIVYALLCLAIIGGIMYLGWYLRHPNPKGVQLSPVYNGFNFEFVDGQWMTEWQGRQYRYQLAFRYHPQELENISMTYGESITFNEARGSPPMLYLAFDPYEDNESLAYLAFENAEISKTFVMFLDTNVTPVCTSIFEGVCPTENEVMTCDTVTDKAIVFLDASPGPSVSVNKNCVIIRGEGEDLIRAGERFLYTSIFRIMK